MGIIVEALKNKQIPLRVVHNDTKLNNIMFDRNTKKSLCLIDLDTTMKGSMLYDFGDALRKGASTTTEDDTNLDNVKINFELVSSFVEGFLKSVKSIITDNEIKLLYDAYYILTLELSEILLNTVLLECDIKNNVLNILSFLILYNKVMLQKLWFYCI